MALDLFPFELIQWIPLMGDIFSTLLPHDAAHGWHNFRDVALNIENILNTFYQAISARLCVMQHMGGIISVMLP